MQRPFRQQPQVTGDAAGRGPGRPGTAPAAARPAPGAPSHDDGLCKKSRTVTAGQGCSRRRSGSGQVRVAGIDNLEKPATCLIKVTNTLLKLTKAVHRPRGSVRMVRVNSLHKPATGLSASLSTQFGLTESEHGLWCDDWVAGAYRPDIPTASLTKAISVFLKRTKAKHSTRSRVWLTCIDNLRIPVTGLTKAANLLLRYQYQSLLLVRSLRGRYR